MARYSKIALYKLQNEIHKVRPVNLTDPAKKIVKIPEAHVPMSPPAHSNDPASTDLKEPFSHHEQEESVKKGSSNTPKTTKKPSSKAKPKKAAAKKSSNKKATPMAKYSKKAGKKVEKTMHEMKKGTLKSGSGKKVKSSKQAIAIGLSEARKAGAKVPKAPAKKTASVRSASKKAAPKKAMAKKSAAKKSK